MRTIKFNRTWQQLTLLQKWIENNNLVLPADINIVEAKMALCTLLDDYNEANDALKQIHRILEPNYFES
jgi:hypothetical protein